MSDPDWDDIIREKVPAHQSQVIYPRRFTHEMDWSTLQVVDRARRQVKRRVREAFHIYKRQPTINRDSGLERSAVWNAVL